MEKRKWLWKRKSSERSPGETESSESISSHSERYSDDQEAFKVSPNRTIQSLDITSKAITNDEDVDYNVRILTEKLSAALVNVSAKDDLVKQHAKVAEEAIAGWEKAENEVVVFKQKLDAAAQQNSTLEHRVIHLDGALKECVRQLRLAKEEQDQKIDEAVAKTALEWRSTKVELEHQLLELHDKAESITSGLPAQNDVVHQKLESLEREHTALKLEFQSQSEELEIRTIERDLSTQAAETASKQHLMTIKKVAKLEAECRRLKALALKSSMNNDHISTAASSIYVDSLTDSQSDSGDRLNGIETETQNQFSSEKGGSKMISSSSIELDLMDDFLEMERLAALAETKNEISHDESNSDVKNNDAESSLRAELDAMMNRLEELEEKLEKLEGEKAEMEIELLTKDNAEALLRSSLESMINQTSELEYTIEKMEIEKAELISELSAKKSDNEVTSLRSKLEAMTLDVSELKESLAKAEAEKAKLVSEYSTKQSKIETHLRSELEAMLYQVSELEVKLEKMETEKAELEMSLNQNQKDFEASEICLREVEANLDDLQKELCSRNESKQLLESKLINMEIECRTMSSKVKSLEADVEKERTLSAQTADKCEELEEELLRTKQEAEFRQIATSTYEPKIKQEDMAVAAGKLAECQKTIASLGQQLQSLATLEDFLIDTASIPGFSTEAAALVPSSSAELWKSHSNKMFSHEDSDSTKKNKNDNKAPLSSPSSHPISEKHRNGFAKFLTRSKNGILLDF